MTAEIESNDAATTDQSTRETQHWSGRRIGRRRLIAGMAALGPLAASTALLRSGGSVAAGGTGRRVAHVGRAQTASTPVAATPVAGPEMLGQLQVIRDARPAYEPPATDGGELRLLLPAGDNRDFSPAAFRQDFQVMASYLDPLIWIDEVSMEPVAGLAESWDVSDDGTTVTYTLRDDVRWHDGSRLAAEDVVFSLYLYRDDLDSAVRNFFVNMQSAEASNRTTVVVTLSNPDANWLLNASTQFVVQQAQYEDFWTGLPEGERTLTGFDWSDETPIGTGPWKIDRVRNSVIDFSRNDDYWDGPPHFETMTLSVEEDANARLAAWKEGTADLLWPVNVATVQAASDTAGRLYVADAASVMFAAFNFDNPAGFPNTLLTDLRIRQALSLAIDRNRYATEVFGGFIHADRAGTIAQPWANNPAVVNPARDVARAKALLTEAGWTVPVSGGLAVDAAGNELKLSVIVRNDARQELSSVLQSIVPDLAEIGVELRVRALSPERFLTVWTETREYDLIAYAYNLFPGFTDFDLYGTNWDIRQNPQGWNPGGYSNETVDQALRDFVSASSDTAGYDALQTIQQETNDDLFALWFGFPQELILVRPDISGFQPNIIWETWNTRQLWRQS